MNLKMLLGVLTLSACSAASADELGARLSGAYSTPSAALYVAFPVAGRRHEGPSFGLRMERQPAIDLAGLRADGRRPTALLEVPFNKRRDDTDALAAHLLGKGVIVGIVVGALVVVSAVNDDDNGGGGGY